MDEFYLGTHRPGWLWAGAAGPSFRLFVSARTLGRCSTLRPATVPGWALDSGGFTELSTYGEWRTMTPLGYVLQTAELDREVDRMEWAAPMDWMCEPAVLARTGLTVAEHQRRTVANFLELTELWPDYSDADSPFMPVLQGWTHADYLACARMYAAAGVRLEDFPLVGLGSVCRRQATGELGPLLADLTPWLALHGFGFKWGGLLAHGHRFTSADSMAWSYNARRNPPMAGHPHASCNNCLAYATAWRARLVDALDQAEARGYQPELGDRRPPCSCCGSPICLAYRPGYEPEPDPAGYAPAGIYEVNP